MLTTDRSNLLDQLIETSIADFDVPFDVHARAVSRYEALGNWLAGHWDDHPAGGIVYPQGSIRLGTMVAPVTAGAEYDVDLVCRRELAKESTTQKELKADVGAGVAAFVASGPEGFPRQREGKRCWTLDYTDEPFHMDVLPALPDIEAQPNGILLTDRELSRWQRSNPVDFADWFYGQMAREYREVREALAKKMDVEDVPTWYVKTTLQRIVQALKRHRDVYFVDAPEDRPASIIITTLAARAYNGEGALFELLVDVATKMTTLVERREGVWWVANPVQPLENFADRWNSKPGSDECFFRWIHQAAVDFAAFGEERGIDAVLTKLGKSFGEGPKRATAVKYGREMREARDAGLLGMTAGTGTLGAATPKSRPVRPHVFHGDAPERP
jgi:Cyclic GMP-AMP synthase DncV-like, nucleotidyltransferase domain